MLLYFVYKVRVETKKMNSDRFRYDFSANLYNNELYCDEFYLQGHFGNNIYQMIKKYEEKVPRDVVCEVEEMVRADKDKKRLAIAWGFIKDHFMGDWDEEGVKCFSCEVILFDQVPGDGSRSGFLMFAKKKEDCILKRSLFRSPAALPCFQHSYFVFLINVLNKDLYGEKKQFLMNSDDFMNIIISSKE